MKKADRPGVAGGAVMRAARIGFTPEELATIIGALGDSSGMRSDLAWYDRCNNLCNRLLVLAGVDDSGSLKRAVEALRAADNSRTLRGGG